MPEYRTPEEDRAQAAEDARIRAVLEDAVLDGASCLAAMALDEPADVVERWVDAVWDQLRAALTPEDRLRAIVLLLDERARTAAVDLLCPVRAVDDV